MKNLASEFQTVAQLYIQLENELGSVQADDSSDFWTYLESILRKRDCLARMNPINSRALQLSDEWKKCRSKLDTKTQTEIGILAEDLRSRAIRLNQLCGIHAQKVQAARAKLAIGRAELGKGARYLKSMQPVKNNYPKFIDSLY